MAHLICDPDSQQRSRRTTSEQILRPALVLTAIGVVLALAGCGQDSPSILDPRGPGAARIATLWWWLFALGGAVFVVVVATLAVAIMRARRADHESTGEAIRFVVIGGIAIPAVTLLATFGLTLWTTLGLADADQTDLTIEVIGHQFWWEVRYPDEDVVTANEIHIPVGQPVTIQVTTSDVIHSFWVPQLHGKIDLIPGRANTIQLQADEPGEYRGICAEFCGLAHAHMQFLVVASPADEFPAWLERQRQDAPLPEDDIVFRGEQLFLSSACVYCHTVRGTNDSSELGPDLTHLASRRTLAGGILENNRGNLAAWLLDPQTIKPGNAMPGTDFSGEDLQAILTYLESLE